jgi:hypothetical protein
MSSRRTDHVANIGMNLKCICKLYQDGTVALHRKNGILPADLRRNNYCKYSVNGQKVH